MKYIKIQDKYKLSQLSPVEIYRLIYTRTIKKFPSGYWQQPDSVEKAIEIIRYLIEQVLKWDDQALKENLSYKVFIRYHLTGMLRACFQSKFYEAISQAYPGKFKEWDFRVAEWTEAKLKTAVRWFIEEKLQWTDEQLKRNLSQDLFYQYGMGCILSNYLVKYSPIRAIQIVYPGKFKDWEIGVVPKNYWNKENITKATRWLIEEKLGWSDDEVKQKLTGNLFVQYGLGGMMVNELIGNSPFRAINIAYSGKFSPDDFRKVPMNHWNEENIAKKMRWLIEEKLQWDDDQVRLKLTQDVLKKYHLIRILSGPVVDNKLFRAVDLAYPGRFKESDFNHHRKRRAKNAVERSKEG